MLQTQTADYVHSNLCPAESSRMLCCTLSHSCTWLASQWADEKHVMPQVLAKAWKQL